MVRGMEVYEGGRRDVQDLRGDCTPPVSRSEWIDYFDLVTASTEDRMRGVD